MLPGDELAVGVEPGLHRVHVGRPVAPALHVVLAGPLHLDRRAASPSARAVDTASTITSASEHRAPAEAAAGLHHVQPHLVRRDAGDLGRDRLVEVGHLVPAPDLDHPVLAHPRHRVHRLERGVGEVGELEASPRAPSPRRRAPPRRRPPRAPSPRAAPATSSRYSRHDLGRAARLGIGLVPLHGDRVAGLAAPPTCARRRRRPRAASAPRRRRPGIAFAAAASNDAALAPNFGGWIMTAVSIPGSFTSRVKGWVPLVFDGAVVAAELRVADQRPLLRRLQRHLRRHRHRRRRARRARRSRGCRRSDASALPSATGSRPPARPTARPPPRPAWRAPSRRPGGSGPRTRPSRSSRRCTGTAPPQARLP